MRTVWELQKKNLVIRAQKFQRTQKKGIVQYLGCGVL